MQPSCRTKPRLRLEQSRPASAVGVEPPWYSVKRRRRGQSFTKELQEKKKPKDKGRREEEKKKKRKNALWLCINSREDQSHVAKISKIASYWRSAITVDALLF